MPEVGDECPDCGGTICTPGHFWSCPDRDSGFDGECPMCGQPYESFFAHLSDCTAGETDKPPVASTAEDPEWSPYDGVEEV